MRELCYRVQSDKPSLDYGLSHIFPHLVGQEVGDSYGAAETVRDATFVDECQPCAGVSQGPLRGQAYSRHAEQRDGVPSVTVYSLLTSKKNIGKIKAETPFMPTPTFLLVELCSCGAPAGG